MEENDRKHQDGIFDAVGDMMNTYRELAKVRMAEGAAVGGSASLLGIVLLLVVIFVLLFLGMGLAWWIGDALDNTKAGFFIVGGFYLLLLVVGVLTSRSVILPWLRNLIVRKIYEEV